VADSGTAGTQWHSWLMHYVTRRKIADSITFGIIQFFWPHYDPGVESTCNRNEYRGYVLEGKGCRYVSQTTLPPSCAFCLEICEPEHSVSLSACRGDNFYSGIKGTYKTLCTKYYSGNQIEQNEMGRACSTYGGEERCIQDFGGET
jgi:hypothetical protein